MTGQGLPDLVDLMIAEMNDLSLVLRERGLMGSREALDIVNANPKHFLVGKILPPPAPGAGYSTIAFEPRRVYHELMAAGWRLANEVYGRLVDGGWLATHEPDADYVRPESRVSG